VKNLLINIDESVHALAVRPCQSYWEILCSPGPLAHLCTIGPGNHAMWTELVEGKLGRHPLTPILTRLVNLIDTHHLRYETAKCN
jgi:hypothetical protein